MNIKEQELIKFWTYFGWVYRRSNPNHFKDNPEAQERDMAWYHLSYDVGFHKSPPFDLDSIYCYAIPKLQDKGYSVELLAYECKGFRAVIQNVIHEEIHFTVINDNPTEALYNAILKVIDNDKTK